MALTKATFSMIDGAVVNVMDYGATGDGSTDDTSAIQAALDTRQNVYIPAGTYKTSATLSPYRGQVIFGEGNPERSISAQLPASVLSVAKDVTAIDTTTNTAYGCAIKNLYVIAQDQTNGSGKLGVSLGTKGVVGGSSQGIKCLLEDVYVKGFDIGFGIYGQSWEVTLNRCVSDYHRTTGFDFADTFTLCSATDCSALMGGFAFGTAGAQLANGFSFAGTTSELGCQVYLYSPRMENNLNAGIVVSDNVRVKIDNIYCEGNRQYDVQLAANFDGEFIVSNGCMIHDNDGVTTFAAVRNLSTVKCYIKLEGIKYSLGATSTNTTTAGFYYSENTAPYAVVEGLQVGADVAEMSSGNKKVVYLSQASRYAPAEFTVTDFPQVRFHRSGTSHVAHAYGYLPTTLLISDGTNTFEMLTDNSMAFFSGNVYSYDLATTTWTQIAP